MGQYRTDPCVCFHIVVDDMEEKIMGILVLQDVVVIAGADMTCRYFHPAAYTEFPSNRPLRTDLVYRLRFQTRLGINET